MKKILFTFLFAACAAMGLSSCMNGDYDANPLNANSNANPLLNTGSGGSGGGSNAGIAAKNEIRCLLNGSAIVLSDAKWQDLIIRLFNGSKPTANNGSDVVAFGLAGYTGAGTYTFGEGMFSTGRYSITDFFATPIMKDYTTNAPGGGGELIVTSDTNDEMKGTFSFVAFYQSDKVTVTNGSFYVTKQ